MDKTERDKIVGTNIDGTAVIPFSSTEKTFNLDMQIQADIAFQLTAGVGLLKQLVDMCDVDPNIVDGIMERISVHLPSPFNPATPACCDGLRTAVRQYLYQLDNTGGASPGILTDALAQPCQRDESMLVKAVEDFFEKEFLAGDNELKEGEKVILVGIKNLRKLRTVLFASYKPRGQMTDQVENIFCPSCEKIFHTDTDSGFVCDCCGKRCCEKCLKSFGDMAVDFCKRCHKQYCQRDESALIGLVMNFLNDFFVVRNEAYGESKAWKSDRVIKFESALKKYRGDA